MRQNLTEWEESLKPYFEHIKLLGEIPITHIELEQLGNLIRDLIKRYGQAKATRKFESDYRRTFAVFLAAVAAHNTDLEYWRVVSEAADIPVQRMQQLEWGGTFLGILKDFGLPTFQGIGGYRFVTPIRLHGGIPAYSLPDFFAYILWPSVKKDAYKWLSTEKSIATLLKRTSVQIAVDSPVTNFLNNGGEYAIEFLDRCRKMARLYIQSQEVPPPEDVELPPYVVRIFQQWVDEELETDRGRRLRSPKLFLDPWGPDFYLHLPPETVEGLFATRKYFWRIELQGKENRSYEHIERVRVRRRGYDLETSDVEFPIDKPAQIINVSYCCQELTPDKAGEDVEYTLRRWRIEMLPAENQLPFLVFHPNDGRILRWSQTLPAQELLLLFPKEVELNVAGEGRVLEYFPDLYTFWGVWQTQTWDLSKAHNLQLLKNGKSLRAPIPVLSVPPDPILIGDNLLESNVDPDEVPLYIGSPPWIRLPIRQGRAADSELAQWKLNIESRWVAAPAFHNELFHLSKISLLREEAPNTVDVSLKAILGEAACGTYRVVATGPYDIRTEFHFRVWPELVIDGLEPYYLPEPGGAQKVKFAVKLPKHCELTPQAGAEGVCVWGTEHSYQVQIDPDVTVTDLHLIAPLLNSDPIRLPLSLAIPRLRWSLLLGEDDAEMRWCASPIKSTVGALLQEEQRSLFIDFPLVDELPLILNINLVNPETGKVLQEHIRPQKVHFGKTRWRFTLGEFFDTIRHQDQQPTFEFQLVLKNSENGETSKFSVLRLSRELEISDVKIEFLEKQELRINWTEPRPLRNRRLLIWSEWQPWLLPVEIKIPDEARGDLCVTGIDLPPSYYRLYFFTAASWEEINASPLPPVESHLVKAITPGEMLDWITERLESHANNYLLHFFRACVFEAQGDIKNRDQEIEWCYRNLDQATPKTILAFHYWLGGKLPSADRYRDISTQKAVRTSMFRPDNLQRILQSHPKGDLVRNQIFEIYTSIPLVMPESALIMLANDDDPARVMHSLQILIRRRSPEAINKIIEFIEKSQLSEVDAGELFALNPEFTLAALSKAPESQLKLRLIKRMVRIIPVQEYFVLPGFWIRTEAGWGCIQRIVLNGEEDEISYFNRKTDNPILSVVLRPDGHCEQIEINLSSKVITFFEPQKIYICTKDDCLFFASDDPKYVRNEHNYASHNGIGPAYRPSDPSFRMHKPVIYSLEPPENQYS